MLSLVCFIVSIIYWFLYNKKEIGIVELLGYSYFDIIKKYLFSLLFQLTVLFVICHIFLCFVSIKAVTGNTVDFLKELLIKDIGFLILLFLLNIVVFSFIIKKINLKKSVNFRFLLNFTYILKMICVFLFCFIFVSHFYEVKLSIKSAVSVLKWSDLCKVITEFMILLTAIMEIRH